MNIHDKLKKGLDDIGGSDVLVIPTHQAKRLLAEYDEMKRALCNIGSTRKVLTGGDKFRIEPYLSADDMQVEANLAIARSGCVFA